MDDISRTVKYNSLLSIYGELLSARQKDILEQYFNFNLSISEIAESNGVSRAAVEDAIQKGIRKLDEYENLLHISDEKAKISDIIKNINESDDNRKLKEALVEIQRVIDNGI